MLPAARPKQTRAAPLIVWRFREDVCAARQVGSAAESAPLLYASTAPPWFPCMRDDRVNCMISGGGTRAGILMGGVPESGGGKSFFLGSMATRGLATGFLWSG